MNLQSVLQMMQGRGNASNPVSGPGMPSGGGPGMLPKAVVHDGLERVLPPGAFEDSSNAYWDAQRMGNGSGESFYDIGGSRFGQYPNALSQMQAIPQKMGGGGALQNALQNYGAQ